MKSDLKRPERANRSRNWLPTRRSDQINGSSDNSRRRNRWNRMTAGQNCRKHRDRTHNRLPRRSRRPPAMNSASSYFGKLAWGVRYVGYFNTGLICIAKLAHFASSRFGKGDWFWYFAESRFDKRLGVETLEMVPVAQLDVTEERKLGAIRYEPTPQASFTKYEETEFIAVVRPNCVKRPLESRPISSSLRRPRAMRIGSMNWLSQA